MMTSHQAVAALTEALTAQQREVARLQTHIEKLAPIMEELVRQRDEARAALRLLASECIMKEGDHGS